MPDTAEILRLTNEATVKALITIKNMIVDNYHDETIRYIDELLKSDEVKVDKEIDLLFWRS